MRWPKFHDVISFRPPQINQWYALTTMPATQNIHQTAQEFAREKIRFDNSFRVWIAAASFVVIFALWAGGVLPTIKPVVGVLIAYWSILYAAVVFLENTDHVRPLDFIVCTLDMIALSIAVFWTGGASSPLYFIYFVPLIIQAFHRDWVLILHYGFGGVTMYAVAVLLSLGDVTAASLLDLGARIFFMLMTVSIAAMAVSFLRKQEIKERMRLSRMRMLTQVSQALNQVNSLKDITPVVEDLIKNLNLELGPQLDAWSRVFLIENNAKFMQALADPADHRPELSQQLLTHSCPAVSAGKIFQLKDADHDHGCPTESFNFKSHLCVPVTGPDNEPFGVIFSGSSKTAAFKAEEVQFIEFIAKSLGLTIQRLVRIDDLSMAIEMSSCTVATFVSSMRDLKSTGVSILEGLSNILKAQQSSLMLRDAARGVLKVVETYGVESQPKTLELHMNEGLVGRVLSSNEPHYTSDLHTDALGRATQQTYHSILCVPLNSIKGEPLGVITLWFKDKAQTLTTRHIDIAMTFATRAAVAIENAMQWEQLCQTLEGIQNIDLPIKKVA